MMSGFMVLSCYSFSIVLGLSILSAIIGNESINMVYAIGNNSIMDKQTSNNNETNSLFMKSAVSGSLIPIEKSSYNTSNQVHKLVFSNITSSTFAFSYRPDRIVNLVDTLKFI